MIAITLAVTIPTQRIATKAIITLHTISSITMNEKQSEMAIPRMANYCSSFSVTCCAKNSLAYLID